MVNMQLTKAEAEKEYGSPCATAAGDADNLPKYPYGLTINLDNETLAKLGITDLPDVGYVMNLNAVIVVTDVNSSQSQGNEPHKGATLQITDMALSAPTDNATLGSRLYG